MGNALVLVATMVSVIGAITTIGALYLNRKSDKESNKTQEELAASQILRGVVTSLGEQVDDLKTSLTEANLKADRLNRELNAAQANVMILSEHIRRHLPEVPFPKLRVMNDVG